MKKKVAIVTINDYNNYGNRLQNYALQTLLEDNGMEVETLRVKRILKSKKLKEIFKIPILDILFKINEIFKRKIYKNKIFTRYKNIKQFSDKYIKETEKLYSDRKLNNKVSNQYDAFFVGSDQVWNQNYVNDGLTFFLKGIDDKKKNAFSASIGVEKLSKEYEDILRENLNSFYQISVREESAKNIIEKLLDCSVERLLDPTMLIDEYKWKELFTGIDVKEKYILIYSLGAITKKERKLIKKIANDKNLSIINLADYSSKYYTINPIEFVELIQKAELVFTDSFHGSVFSILMNTPFIVTERKTSNSISSRIDTLLSVFSLEERRISNIANISTEELLSFDEEKVKKVLKNERIKAESFLKSI